MASSSYYSHARYNTGFKFSANTMLADTPQPIIRCIDGKSVDARFSGTHAPENEQANTLGGPQVATLHDSQVGSASRSAHGDSGQGIQESDVGGPLDYPEGQSPRGSHPPNEEPQVGGDSGGATLMNRSPTPNALCLQISASWGRRPNARK